MVHSVGDMCFVAMVHGSWIRVVYQPRVIVEFPPRLVVNPAVTRNNSQFVLGAQRGRT